MSWFDNVDKDRLLEGLEDFLESYTVSELIEVVKAAIERKEEQCGLL